MSEQTIRLDKWLWFARVVKTRTLAQKLVRAKSVRVNKEKISNPAKPVSEGDVLTITLERQIRILEITTCGKRRGPFVEAAKLFHDLSPAPVANSQVNSTSYVSNEKVPRPDKYGRRKLLALKNKQHFQ